MLETERLVPRPLTGADFEDYAAMLADGGTIVLGTFAPSGSTHCSRLPGARYSPDELAAQLAAVLGDEATLIDARTYEHHTPAGSVQPFTWITARLH